MTNHPNRNRSKQQQPTHTPGPWRVCQNGIKECIYAGDRMFMKAPGETIGEIEANARLIAAAPELLAALKELTAAAPHAMKANPRFNQAWHEARAAIAKAEGR